MTDHTDRTGRHAETLHRAWLAPWPLTSKQRWLVKAVSTESVIDIQRNEARRLLALEGDER